eukprot:1631953-Prorocentrum_lima.AAC.1
MSCRPVRQQQIGLQREAQAILVTLQKLPHMPPAWSPPEVPENHVSWVRQLGALPVIWGRVRGGARA